MKNRDIQTQQDSSIHQVGIAGRDSKIVGNNNTETTSFNASIFVGIFFVFFVVLGGASLALYAGLRQGNQNTTNQDISAPEL